MQQRLQGHFSKLVGMQAHALQPSALRADSSLPEQPGSAKMVSLDLLLGANSTPATPRDADHLGLQVQPPPPFHRLPAAACRPV